ncbi:MAG: DUF2911 domain-containing protein [Spirosomaceae bacterium]|nr:DUF2911 domain-containing protein [Spirosomataceae bacterium]
MKKSWKVIISVVVILLIAAAAFFAYTSTLSPEAKLSFENNGVKVDVTYCQPSKKGRDIFGTVVPYGKVWRTGANAATIVSFSKDVTVGGSAVPAGEYTLWTIPNEGNWTIILNKETGQWGTNYDEAEDLMQVNVPAETAGETVEKFTIKLIRAEGGIDMNLMWDETKVTVPIR